MNYFTKEILKQSGIIILWIIGGTMIGKSFSSLNSFSAEFLFSVGVLSVIIGFKL